MRRDNFIATGTPKVFVSSHCCSRVKLSLWPFCRWILGLTKGICARFDLQSDGCDILPVGPGGSTRWVRYLFFHVRMLKEFSTPGRRARSTLRGGDNRKEPVF